MKEYLDLLEAKKKFSAKELKKAGWPWKNEKDIPADMKKTAVEFIGNKASVDEISLFLKMLTDSEERK